MSATNSTALRVTVEEVGWDDPAALAMREAMTAELRPRYADRAVRRPGIEGESIVYTAVAFTPDRAAVGHAALRWQGGDLELKRMYVAPSHRGRGVSLALLAEIEQVAARLGAPRVILQTGDRQPDAVRLYEKAGYTRIPIFPPYQALTYSNCFEKILPGHSSTQR